MSKGTILYIGGFELPDKNAAAHRVLSNAKILRELGYKVVFVDVDKSLPYKNEIINTKKAIQGFENWSRPYPQSVKQSIDNFCNIDTFLEVINKYTDVKAVICYNYKAIAFKKIRMYCIQKNINIIADCTEWYSTKSCNIVLKIIKGFDSFLRMRVVQKRLDGLIVISSYLSNYYRKCKNVILLPPLVDMTEEKWNITASKYNGGKIHFVYAGTLGNNKDKLNLVIECLNKLGDFSNYIFSVVGITKEQYLKDHGDHMEILESLGERIIFKGRLSHTESLRCIKMSDFSIFIREDTRMTKAGFPTKFVESISCGTPVITTRTSDLEDYIIEGTNGFFIDINNKEKTAFDLQKILGMTLDEISKMKKICIESRIFHYENYIKPMETFLSDVGN